MSSLTTDQVMKFVERPLIGKLERDFRDPPFRIFRERDLHVCTYYHLRNYVDSDPDWRVLNEPHFRSLISKKRHAQPDIVLFHRNRPTILIELKFRHKHIGIRSKDQKVLAQAKRKLRTLTKVTYIETVITPKQYLKDPVKVVRDLPPPIFMEKSRFDQYRIFYNLFRKPNSKKLDALPNNSLKLTPNRGRSTYRQSRSV